MAKQERWQLSGNSAEYYDRYVSLLMAPWVRELVNAAEIRLGDRVLDVGCGPGFVARRAAEIVGLDGRVVGQDNNKPMLERARSVPFTGSGVPIEWHESDIQDLDLDDGSFDVALAQQVLQFCPEPGAALREMRRVLVADGKMGFTVWQPLEENPYPSAQLKVFERYLGVDAPSGLRAPYAMGSAEYLRNLVMSAGFTSVVVNPLTISTPVGHAEEFIRGHVQALPFAESVAALSEDARDKMFGDLESELGEYIVDGALEFPSSCFVVTAAA